MLEFLKAPFKAQDPTLFLQYINDLPDYTIYNITIYADESTLYFKCDQIRKGILHDLFFK